MRMTKANAFKVAQKWVGVPPTIVDDNTGDIINNYFTKNNEREWVKIDIKREQRVTESGWEYSLITDIILEDRYSVHPF